MKQQIAEILRHHKRKRIADENLKASAVLIPLFCSQGQYHVLFTERSDEVTFHKGQVSFPGGTQEPSDSSLLQTAIRESEEEIGLKAKDIEILGELDDSTTFTSNYVISPFVGFIPHPHSLKTNGREVKGAFSVPLSFLMDEANFNQDSYAYEYEGHIIWGATARILRQFIDLLKSGSRALE
ncbi:MAG TPA: CoA pyrophosphatase [Dehalococcoidia bacterium]|nr:CoA pyrophosphatase [Dehalococcoidia bacterium]